MTESFAPCPSCARHVKTTEKSCPFCKGALPDAMVSIPGATPGHRLGRAAAFAFTASLTVAGCSAGVAAPGDGGTDEGGGGFPVDASSTDSAVVKKDATAPKDEGGAQPPYGVPAYGAPPFDAGK